MRLLLVGISHKTAPVEVRERVDFQVHGLGRSLKALASRCATREAVVLSTCNRSELYVACDDVTTARADLVNFLSDFNGVDRQIVATHVYDVTDLEAARHLFRVAAGLDSLVVGEPQVLGQVKEAHTTAGEARTVGPVLNRLFHASFTVGKRVRRAPSRLATPPCRLPERSSAIWTGEASSSSAPEKWASSRRGT